MDPDTVDNVDGLGAEGRDGANGMDGAAVGRPGHRHILALHMDSGDWGHRDGDGDGDRPRPLPPPLLLVDDVVNLVGDVDIPGTVVLVLVVADPGHHPSPRWWSVVLLADTMMTDGVVAVLVTLHLQGQDRCVKILYKVQHKVY